MNTSKYLYKHPKSWIVKVSKVPFIKMRIDFFIPTFLSRCCWHAPKKNIPCDEAAVQIFRSLGGAKSSPDSSTQEAEANGTIEPCTGTLGGSKALACGENVSFWVGAHRRSRFFCAVGMFVFGVMELIIP